VILKTELSIPKINGYERQVQKELVEKSLEQFDELFQEKLSNNTFQTPSFGIDTDNLIFTVEKTDSGMGYPRFVTSGLIEVPTDTLCDDIKRRLIEKAVKRDSFKNEHREFHYIIALDCHESSIDAIAMNVLLYGHITHLSALNMTGSSEEDFTKRRLDHWNFVNDIIRNSASWGIIEQAKNQGWEALLIKKCLIPNDYSYMVNEGIFISEKEMKNVSGVLFRDRWNNVTFHPNPFCDTEINDSKILNFKYDCSKTNMKFFG
jgi:hypothetical protein